MNFYEKHCDKYYEWYKQNEAFFRQNEKRIAALRIFSKVTTIAVYTAFVLLLAFLAASLDIGRLIRVTAVSAAAFFIVTAVRSKLNRQRPYEKYELKSLVSKSTKGKSCPSRHSACAVIIAVACLYINVPLGIVMLIIALMIGVSRIVMGVHFPLDVAFGIVLSAVIGFIGFYVL